MILQDIVVVMAAHKRNHFIFNNQSDMFDSRLFKDFQSKLLSHIKKHESVKDETIDSYLPGVL